MALPTPVLVPDAEADFSTLARRFLDYTNWDRDRAKDQLIHYCRKEENRHRLYDEILHIAADQAITREISFARHTVPPVPAEMGQKTSSNGKVTPRQPGPVRILPALMNPDWMRPIILHDSGVNLFDATFGQIAEAMAYTDKRAKNFAAWTAFYNHLLERKQSDDQYITDAWTVEEIIDLHRMYRLNARH